MNGSKKIILLLIIILVAICTIGISISTKIEKFDSKGTAWIASMGAPTSKTNGINGDIYLDTSNYNLYQKKDNEWVLLGNIKGIDGADGLTPTIEISNDGFWILNGKKTNVKAKGIDGKDGSNGTNGKDGIDGLTPTVEISDDGYWVINGNKSTTRAVGLDGKNGVDGLTPTIEISNDGYWIINGKKSTVKAVGIDGANGINGIDGLTPVIEISEDGYWIINGKKSTTRALGKDGTDGTIGTNGTSFLTGTGEPNNSLGINGDVFLNIENYDLYKKTNGTWNTIGNIKGQNGLNGNNISTSNYMHISFDDVQIAFNNLTTNTYSTLWEEPFFGWLKSLNEDYNAKFSLYVYGTALTNVPSTYAKDFKSSNEWLKIGLHASNGSGNFASTSYDSAKSTWNTFASNVLRITGTYTSIDRMPRLHNFAGSEAALQGMRDANYGALGFLSSDDTRTSYYLEDKIVDYLYDNDHVNDYKNGLVFIATDFRGDWFNSFSSSYTYKKPIKDTVYEELEYRFTNAEYSKSLSSYILFTHEWQIYNGSTLNNKKTWIEDACKFTQDNHINFDYPQNRVFNSTPYDIYPVSAGNNDETTNEPITNTTTTDSDTVTIVDSMDDIIFTNGYSISGGETETISIAVVGRAASKYYVLKVNGGETISLNQNIDGISLSYAIKEFKDIPLNSSTVNTNGQVFKAWLTNTITLQSDTKYILIGFKRGDGTSDFTDDEINMLSKSLTIN